MLFEALGVLPSVDVVQVSASEFSTGFVGQTAANTRDIFDSARGAVLFVDEAYRLYDPLGRSYMHPAQEAVDADRGQIVTLLTEEEYRGKMAVVFAGYAGQMTDLLDKVNPGLKSRVSDVDRLPRLRRGDRGRARCADAQRAPAHARRRPRRRRARATWMAALMAAPRWANGRDIETYVRRVAVECAVRKTSAVEAAALDAALATVLQIKRPRDPCRRRRRRRRRRRLRRPTPSSQAFPDFDLAEGDPTRAAGGRRRRRRRRRRRGRRDRLRRGARGGDRRTRLR